jgi:hypothetical protein
VSMPSLTPVAGQALADLAADLAASLGSGNTSTPRANQSEEENKR